MPSYADLVNDPEVDVVYNPLPNSLHAPWNVAAIEAGKHLFSEKPFASNAVEAAMVRDVAAGRDQVVFEGFHYRYHPIFGRLLQVSTDGTIGVAGPGSGSPCPCLRPRTTTCAGRGRWPAAR